MLRYQHSAVPNSKDCPTVYLISKNEWKNMKDKFVKREDSVIIIRKDQSEFLKQERVFDRAAVVILPKQAFSRCKADTFKNVVVYVYLNAEHKESMRAYLLQFYGVNVSEGDFTDEIEVAINSFLDNIDVGRLELRKPQSMGNNSFGVIKPKLSVDNQSQKTPLLQQDDLNKNEEQYIPKTVLCEDTVYSLLDDQDNQGIPEPTTITTSTVWKPQFSEYQLVMLRHSTTMIKKVPSDENVDDTFRRHARVLKPLGKWEHKRLATEIQYSVNINNAHIQPNFDGISKVDSTHYQSSANEMLQFLFDDHIAAHMVYVMKYISKHPHEKQLYLFPMLLNESAEWYLTSNMTHISADGIKSSLSACDDLIWMIGDGWKRLAQRKLQNIHHRIWFKHMLIACQQWLSENVSIEFPKLSFQYQENSDIGIGAISILW